MSRSCTGPLKAFLTILCLLTATAACLAQGSANELRRPTALCALSTAKL